MDCDNIIDLLEAIAIFIGQVVRLWERSPVGVCISVAIMPLVLTCLVVFPWLFKAKVLQRTREEMMEETRTIEKIDTRTGERTFETEQKRLTKIG